MTFDLNLPCGLRVWVAHQPDGVGNIKEYVGEYLWCVESGATVHARSFAAESDAAVKAGLEAACHVLLRSNALISAAIPEAST